MDTLQLQNIYNIIYSIFLGILFTLCFYMTTTCQNILIKEEQFENIF